MTFADNLIASDWRDLGPVFGWGNIGYLRGRWDYQGDSPFEGYEGDE